MFFRTAAKIAWRDLHAAPGKFLFVVLAVAIGVAALSGVKGFGYAFKGMLLKNAKQLIAADVQAQTWNDVTSDQLSALQKLAQKDGMLTRVTETVSMAASPNQRVPLLVSVKGVDPTAYPLYGTLTLSPACSLSQLLRNDSDVVVSPELLLRFKVPVSGTIRLGGQDFHIVGELITEPDRLASGFGPGMRIMMTRAGLDRTGLIQYGSRAAQRFLFKLKPNIDLDTMRAQLKTILPRIHQRLPRGQPRC